MRYEQALKDKNLTTQDLAKQTQKKIEKLLDLVDYLKEFKEEELDDEDKNNYETIKERIQILDNQLEKAILKFDKDIYQKRLEVFEINRQKGYQKIEMEDMPKSTSIETKIEKPKIDINQKLEELKKEVSINTKKFKQEVVQEEVQEDDNEVIEFEKKAEIKPKKSGIGLALVVLGGIGVFIGSVLLNKK